MKYALVLLITLLSYSCIPLKVAPDIADGKVYAPKKFKKQLPKQHTYVFNDPKDANEFYNYVNAKFQIVYDDATGNIPITMNDKTYYLTFYEVERDTKTVNLVPILVNSAMENKGYTPAFEEAEVTRVGYWYVALTISDTALGDALDPNYKDHKEVLQYANHMRNEYLTTVEYIEVYLRSTIKD